MPLPSGNIEWPPRQIKPVYAQLHTHGAWWKGDTDTLEKIYSQGQTRERYGRQLNLAGGRVRFFWGKKQTEAESRPKLHIPLAADIAGTSADMLYSTPPQFTLTDNKNSATVDRIGEYVDNGLHGALLEGAEIGAAYSGRFLVPTFIPGVNNDLPFVETKDPLHAVPEFQWGQLVAVTFWEELDTDQYQVIRHLERHELHNGLGYVFHGLYIGTKEMLGRAVPLTEHPVTAPLAEFVNSDGQSVGEPTPGLGAVLVPNVTPARQLRGNPYGQYLGRSDFEGVEPLFDALDDAWTSWMRDLRLGRARVLAARSLLDDGKPGTGGSFDIDREVFEGLDGAIPGRDNGLPLKEIQFNIRVEEHAATTNALFEQAIRNAGYSQATFGEHTGDADVTATEIKAREKRTNSTKGRKILLERAALKQVLRQMLYLDQVNTGAQADPDTPITVEFDSGTHESLLERANIAQALRNAEAASLWTRIALVNPEWDDDQLQKEYDHLKKELNQGTDFDVDSYRPPGTTVDDRDE